MGGNTFSKEDADEDATSPTVDVSKTKTAPGHSKRDLTDTKDKSANPILKEDKTKGTKTSPSKAVIENPKAASKDNMPKKESKLKNKDGHGTSKKLNDERKATRDPSKEDKDIFARIAAGETTTVVSNPPPPNATVAQDNNKGHGHYLQRGRFRYSPGFEFIRNNANKDAETQKQKNKKSNEEVVSPNKTDDKKVKTQSSAEVINQPVKLNADGKTAKKSPDTVNTKRPSVKAKNEKNEKSDKQSKHGHKRKSANSTGTNASVGGKETLSTKSKTGSKGTRAQEPKSKVNGKTNSVNKESIKKETVGKQSLSSKPKSTDGH